VTDDPTPTVTETSPEPPVVDAAQQQRDFIKAQGRRNVMIALSLVAFMVLIFSITAIRLTQNVSARQDAIAAEEEALTDAEATSEE
jgi:TRAP-type C4-dicarboxylate transport system permease small subunit